MAPGSAALALKAAALVSVVALLVVPSLGRCGHSPPPPPAASTTPPPTPLPPTPAPALGPGPMISCDDCSLHCLASCNALVREQCGDECDRVAGNCEERCKARMIEDCKANNVCPSADTCDCNNMYDHYPGCASSCSILRCHSCEYGHGRQCSEDCWTQCSAPNCIPSSPEN